MNRNNSYSSCWPFRRVPYKIFLGALIAAALAAIVGTARGQIFVVNNGSQTVGKYYTSGAPINVSFITGLNRPQGIAVSEGYIYVANSGVAANTGTIGKYTLEGATVNASLITGLNFPLGVAVSGTDLFVSNTGGTVNSGSIGKYTTSGATVNAALITGLNNPYDVELSGADLFVLNRGSGGSADGTIGKYAADSGAIVNAALVTELTNPQSIALSEGYLYVTSVNAGTIGKYTIAGATVNAALVAGLSAPSGIAVTGTNLLVANSSTSTNKIGQYTTSGATVNAALVTGLNTPRGIAVLPPTLTGAVSQKTHGATAFDINLPLTGEPGVECRSSGGNHTLIFAFNNNPVSGTASVTSGTGSVSGSPIFAGNFMIVNLTGVADVQKITVTLSGVTDNLMQVMPNTSVSMNMLIGDTSGNKIVNSSDVSQTKGQSGGAVNGSNFREDVAVNGAINASDVALVKSRSGFGVP